MSSERTKVEKKAPWLGPIHLARSRIQQFVNGDAELDETEYLHIIVCLQCSHRIADLILSEIEERGDHPHLRKLLDKLFQK